MSPDAMTEICPDERETLRVGAYLIERLVREMTGAVGEGLGWQNEFSVQTVLQLKNEWLPHALTFYVEDVR